MEEAGTLPTSLPERRFSVGAECPVADPVAELPASLHEPLLRCASGDAGIVPPGYGDAGGLWVTVRRQNPFEVLLLDPRWHPSTGDVLTRFRALSAFWTQKLTISRQGATRTALRQKYGEGIESYAENLQWAYDQLSTDDGIAFWRKRLDDEHGKTLWSRVADSVDATLADGLLDQAETTYLMSRAESVGYKREEFAAVLRDVLHARRFEPEVAPVGDTESARLASVRWATADVWKGVRAAAAQPKTPAEEYYVKVRQNGAVLGPLTPANVRELIRTNRVNATDDICVVGATVWQPVAQSRFAHLVQSQAGPATYPCPRCGFELVVETDTTTAAWLVLILGLFLTVVYVGVVLLIVGIVMLAKHEPNQHWKCRQCGYRSR
jgi:hypothetical protein